MLDRRQSPRDKVLFGGVAEINERGSTMDCVVRNISEGGACVEIDQARKLPEEINLTIPRKGRSFLARMIWRQANRVGLAFRTMVTDRARKRPRRAAAPQPDQAAPAQAPHQGTDRRRLRPVSSKHQKKKAG